MSTYGGGADTPGAENPGPDDRGQHLFSGSPTSPRSAIRQSIRVDSTWSDAIRAGRVKAAFSAYLGGLVERQEATSATLSFLDSRSRSLGKISLAPVTSLDREAKTALLPAYGEAAVPTGSASFVVDLQFAGPARSNAALADNLRLVLTEYAP
jgi:hypothetical protein